MNKSTAHPAHPSTEEQDHPHACLNGYVYLGYTAFDEETGEEVERDRVTRRAMIIEIWRKLIATDYSITSCGICGNDFDRGSVFALARLDLESEIGEICDGCLKYLNLRKEDEEDPTLGNWPARNWPTVRDLEEARRRYPEAMFPHRSALLEALDATPGGLDAIHDATVVWSMETPAF